MVRSTAQRSLAAALFALAAALSTIAPQALAATRTWTGGGSLPLWSDTGNWSSLLAPVAGDDLVFPDALPNSASVNDLAAGTSFVSITMTGAHQITGNAVTLTGATPLAFSAPADGTTITFNPAVTLTNAAAKVTVIQATSIAAYVNLGPVTIGGGSLTADVQGNLAFLYFTGAVGETSTASLTKTGDGEALLTVDNSYSGVTTVNGGRLRVGANGGLGVGTNIAANGTVVNNNGSLDLYNGAQVANERVEIYGSGANGNGSFQTSSGDVGWGGDFVIADGGLSLNSLATSLTISGKVTGPGSFRFGRSTVTLLNTGNDYAGGTVIGQPSGGTSKLVIGATGGVIPDGSFVQILGGSTSTLDLNGLTETIGSLGGTGNFDVHGGTLITGADNTASTFFGTFLGTGVIRKTGTGTWSLGGGSPAYTGGLDVLGGTVLVNGQLGGSASVSNGAILGGTGVAGDIFTINLGNGIIAPGASPGRLTASGLVLSSGNTFRVELNGTTAGTQYDQLVVTGSVVTQGTLEVTLGFVPALGDVFRIIDNTSAGAISNTFAGLPEGAKFTVGATQFQISYVGGTGNDVTLTVVPAGPGAPSITTASPLTNGQVGVSYSTTIAGSGGTPPYAWSVTAGALPAGLTLNPTTGAITGTPTAAGTANFTVTLTDNASQTANKPFSLTITPATLAVATTSLPGGTAGAAYTATLTASGGVPPYTWSLASGSLPPGITLNTATGALSGTPTTPGTYAFTVAVTDSEVDARVIAPKATAVQPLSIVIAAAASTQPIPTLGQWSLALLSLLTALAGMLATRRRRA